MSPLRFEKRNIEHPTSNIQCSMKPRPLLTLRPGQRRGLGGRGGAGQRGEDAVDVDVAVLDEEAVLVLRAADGGAGDVEAGDVGLHGAVVVRGGGGVADQLYAG